LKFIITKYFQWRGTFYPLYNYNWTMDSKEYDWIWYSHDSCWEVIILRFLLKVAIKIDGDESCWTFGLLLVGLVKYLSKLSDLFH